MWWWWSCSEPEPVVSGVEPVPVEEVTARREAAEAATRPEAADTVYQKAEGVYVDLRFLSGRPYARIRGEIQAQLGGVVSARDLGELGEEKTLERGVLRVDRDGMVYMIALDLPEALRRSEALAQLGVPQQVDRWQDLPLEFRANHVFGIRRLRLFRAEKGAEEVARVEAWWYLSAEKH